MMPQVPGPALPNRSLPPTGSNRFCCRQLSVILHGLFYHENTVCRGLALAVSGLAKLPPGTYMNPATAPGSLAA